MTLLASLLDLHEAEQLLLLAKDIFIRLQETLYLKLTYLYLVIRYPISDENRASLQVFTYHDASQVDKRKQMAKCYKQVDVKLDTKPMVI